MKDVLQIVLESIVDFPDNVEIKEITSANTSVFEVRVEKSDLGKVIGRKGQNISAIRTLTTAMASKLKKRVIIELVEDD